MIDCRDTPNIMPLLVMRTIVLDYTRQCQVGECIFFIDSRSVLTYVEIKDFYAKIGYAP